MLIKNITNNLDLTNSKKSFKIIKTHESINDFSDFIKNSLDKISYDQNITENNIKNFQTNQSHNSLSNIMIDLQKSSLALQFTIQIRNKIVSSYQDIMNMQI